MAKSRIGIGKIAYETNSFSTLEADLAYFQAEGRTLLGQKVLEQSESRCEVNGFLNALKARGEEIERVPLLSVALGCGGNVTEESVSYLDELLRQALREAGELDGMLFALHGSMGSAKVPDLEGHFLEIIREEKGQDIPVVSPLDLHAIVTRKMVQLATVLIAYRTTPHVDVIKTGERAGNILLRILSGEIKPVMAMKNVPVLIPPNEEGTRSGPLKELFDRMGELGKRKAVVTCSFCCGNPWLDVPEQGWMAVAVTDNDLPLAQEVADELVCRVQEKPGRYLPGKMLSPEDAVRAAASAEGCPVVLLDYGDIPGGGAPGDTTELLEVLVKRREMIDGLILLDLPDPEAVAQIIAAGPGATVTVSVGGKSDTRFGKPLSVKGEVLRIAEGPVESVWKDRDLPFIDAGRIVSLGIDNVRLVLTEKRVLFPQPFLFRKVGLEPFEAKIVVLKTGRIGYRIAYEERAGAVFSVDSHGATSPNFRNFEFRHVPSSMFPDAGA